MSAPLAASPALDFHGFRIALAEGVAEADAGCGFLRFGGHEGAHCIFSWLQVGEVVSAVAVADGVQCPGVEQGQAHIRQVGLRGFAEELKVHADGGRTVVVGHGPRDFGGAFDLH